MMSHLYITPVLKNDVSDLQTVTPEVENFFKWFSDYGMQINTRKTKVMNVCFCKDPFLLVPLFEDVSSLKI